MRSVEKNVSDKGRISSEYKIMKSSFLREGSLKVFLWKEIQERMN